MKWEGEATIKSHIIPPIKIISFPMGIPKKNSRQYKMILKIGAFIQQRKYWDTKQTMRLEIRIFLIKMIWVYKIL